VVWRLLKAAGYSLQANAKTAEGRQHPDRDGQFRYINDTVRAHQADGQPVISVDAMKKQLIGPYKNNGREWMPKGQPEPVNVYDFIDPEQGKVTPYGVYDVTTNTGWVGVGTDHDTAAFAVATIGHWWDQIGRAAYPDATRLLITADGGGSNGSRTRQWKTALAALATRTGLTITVTHLPPGTSKWNKSLWPCVPPGSDEMLAVAHRARSPSRYWSALSPKQVWCRARGTWDCRCEHEPQIRCVARSLPGGSSSTPRRRRDRRGTDPRSGCRTGCAP